LLAGIQWRFIDDTGPRLTIRRGDEREKSGWYDQATVKRLSQKGFTIVESVLAVAILSGVGLVIGEVFIRTNRMSDNIRQSERAVALADMVFEQYNAYAARRYDRLPSLNCTRVKPRDFFPEADDFGYGSLYLTTRAEPSPEDSYTRVTVRVSWGAGLFPPSLTFTKIYPERMNVDVDDGEIPGV
jgi:type II secretory pathway pseudopilin PulG